MDYHRVFKLQGLASNSLKICLNVQLIYTAVPLVIQLSHVSAPHVMMMTVEMMSLIKFFFFFFLSLRPSRAKVVETAHIHKLMAQSVRREGN